MTAPQSDTARAMWIGIASEIDPGSVVLIVVKENTPATRIVNEIAGGILEIMVDLPVLLHPPTQTANALLMIEITLIVGMIKKSDLVDIVRSITDVTRNAGPRIIHGYLPAILQDQLPHIISVQNKMIMMMR